MAQPKYTIYKYVRLKDGSWRYCRAALYANHTIKPDVVTVGGKDEKHPEGNYYLACAGQWIPAGPDALKAQRQRHEATDVGELAVYNAADIALVNKRVSDLDEYKVVGEAAIFFDTGKYTLDDAAKAALDAVSAYTKGLDNYMVEIAGYASSTGTKQVDQKLSADRAAAVAHYLMEKHNIPMRRILAPAGYGASHPVAENTDPQGRALNRRVDVKVLVNKGLSEGD